MQRVKAHIGKQIKLFRVHHEEIRLDQLRRDAKSKREDQIMMEVNKDESHVKNHPRKFRNKVESQMAQMAKARADFKIDHDTRLVRPVQIKMPDQNSYLHWPLRYLRQDLTNSSSYLDGLIRRRPRVLKRLPVPYLKNLRLS
jgi:hypothetical protein